MTEYSFGYNENMINQLKKREALKDAAFLLPYLKANISLLDCGCGPGSISVGFARLLESGKVIAIDVDDKSLKEAEETAKKQALHNIFFQKSNILDLPFAENTFDVVFTRATLYHLKENKKAIKEMLRVTKNGGIIAAVEPDIGGMFYYPEDSAIKEAQKIRTEALTKDGADLILGRKLKRLFIESGCSKAIGFSTSEARGDLKSLQEITEYLANELSDTPWGQELVKQNFVTKEKIKYYQDAYRKFAQNSGAFMVFNWCEAIGFK